MKVETKNNGVCQLKVTVKADATETQQDYNNVLKSFMREGQVPGFRKGKVPREFILSRFQKEIKEEVEGRLFRRFYGEILEKGEIKVVTLLGLEDVFFSPEIGMNFTMLVDVAPEFEVPKYKKIAIKPEAVAVTDEEIEQEMLNLRKGYSTFEDATEEQVAALDDLVQINYEGTLNGEPAAEVVEAFTSMAQGTDHWMHLAEGRFLAEFIESLPGLKVGEECTIKVTFPKDHPTVELQGVKATYQAKINKIRKMVLCEDETLLERTRLSSIDELRELMRSNMLHSREAAEAHRQEQVVIEHLLKQSKFDLPESELKQEVDRNLDQMMEQAYQRGIQVEHLQKERQAIVKEATARATGTLRLRYVLAAIAAAEGVEVTQEELARALNDLAEQLQLTPAEAWDRIKKNDRVAYFQQQVSNEKMMKMLIAQSTK